MIYTKRKSIALILCIFLGAFGVHKFYLGRIIPGILYLVLSWTFIPLFLAVIDLIILLMISQEEFDERYNY